MDTVRFGADHHDHFDPKEYLNSYHKPEQGKLQDLDQVILKCYFEFWSKMAKTNLRILEFGGGPVIRHLIPAAPYAKEIIFAEYTERNRQEVEKWLLKSPDSHDWLPYFKFVVQNLEEKKSEEVAIRESELRKKITHVLPSDIDLKDPVKWPSSWPSQAATFDVVTSSLCLEACVTSSEGYRYAIRKLKRYLKPGGCIVLFCILDETFYMVGQERFYCFPMSKQLVVETLASEGFKMLDDVKAVPLENVAPYCDGKEVIFVSAVLQDD